MGREGDWGQVCMAGAMRRMGEGEETQVCNKHTVLSFFCHTKRLYPTPALLLALILHLTHILTKDSFAQ